MTLFELRQWLESLVPWWFPLAFGVLLVGLSYVLGRLLPKRSK